MDAISATMKVDLSTSCSSVMTWRGAPARARRLDRSSSISSL